MNLSDEKLLARYGSWTEVLASFYDFILQRASKLCPEHFNDMAARQARGDSKKLQQYFRAMLAQAQEMSSAEEAWDAFVAHSLGDEN
jgi:hypothetical protein